MKEINEMTLPEILALAEVGRHCVVPVWRPAYDEEGDPSPPDNDRPVLVFLNGHVDLGDSVGRRGGGWGVRRCFYRYDKHRWAHDDDHVTHWCEEPAPPERSAIKVEDEPHTIPPEGSPHDNPRMKDAPGYTG